ncbi:MAG TPA: SpoIID/LytB domain-containing protein [Verrucomicrobiae bacterium]|nr:SpoIID/LytB domain-containing protein [Verrucomicrobiae bacterium]
MKTLAAILLPLPLLATPATLKVRIGTQVTEMTVEKYVAAVLAGESSSFRSDEALKAMAVAARSYGLHWRGRHAKDGYDLCSTTHCQHLEPNGVTARIESLTAQTAGEILWYQGKPIFACYSRNCGGVTEDAAAVWGELGLPFLSSHPDPYCTRKGSTSWEWSAPITDVVRALQRALLKAPSDLTQITVAQRTPSGRARVLLLAGADDAIPLAASSFRFALGRILGWATVRSDRFEIASDGSRLLFHGTGEGHGVGLCQRGADQMGLEGVGYRDILAFYYPGTVLGLTAQGLRWARLSGETVVLQTTQPARDRAVLASAERQVKDFARQTGWTPPGQIELRVYPDLDTFRNATGEPGWVAAHTAGTRIEIQPVNVLSARGALDSTIRHELLHIFVDSQARPGLPVWFREGLVGYLDGARSAPAALSDADLRQTADEARARRAYAAAIQRVASLVQRHGLTTVLSWLPMGQIPDLPTN